VSDRFLDVRSLDAGYLGAAVVRNMSLAVGPGEVVALLGPNGAGKTTTLDTVAGLLPLISGRIEVLGRPVDGAKPHRVARRGLAYVPEDRSIFFGLTVRENLTLGSRRGKIDTAASSSTSRRSQNSCAALPASCRAASSRCSRWAGPSRRSPAC